MNTPFSPIQPHFLPPHPHTIATLPIPLPATPRHAPPGQAASSRYNTRSQKGRNQRRGSLGPIGSVGKGRGSMGGPGLIGPAPIQVTGPPPTAHAIPFALPACKIPSGQGPVAPTAPPPFVPRPHPHLNNTDLYITNVPADLPEAAIADALQDCLPVRIKLSPAVNPEDRLKPDQFYNWMPRSGTLHFTNLHNAEKALAILIAHPYLAHAGLIVSPFPPPSSPQHLPNILPFPDPPVPARYIRPTQQVMPSSLDGSSDQIAIISAQVPSLGELFDLIRPWGSVRQITVWFEEGHLSNQRATAISWSARVLFWYDDEARRFEHGFGATGTLVKGWQILIFAEELVPAIDAITPGFAILPTTQNIPKPCLPVDNSLNQVTNIDPEIMRRMGIPIFPIVPPVNSLFSDPLMRGPLTPPELGCIPPWANHNMFANPGSAAVQPPAHSAHDRRLSHPVGSNHHVGSGGRRSVSSNKLAQAGHVRQRTWSVTLTNSAEGELVPTGLVADDGTMIHHGPGQHIRPAPDSGPGSTSVSGLVDYANIFVKNLDPDINSYFLEDLFSNLGRIVSAKVMRDEQGRSRGYGFVSFYAPAEAAHAIAVMNNTRVGNQLIAVTHHEPRKLRPEKMAERYARAVGTPYGRPAPLPAPYVESSTQNDKRGRRFSVPAAVYMGPGTTDEIRLLSPTSRRVALASRISDRVKRYARVNKVPDGYIEPAIKALASYDLEIIPMLHDFLQLEHKIAETLSVLQEDPELNINIGVAPAGPHPPYEDPKSTPESPLTEEQLRDKLIEEVRKIDPIDAIRVVDILWPLLTPPERIRAGESRGFLAARYGVAKRKLMQGRERTMEIKQEDPEEISTSTVRTRTETSDSSISSGSATPRLTYIPLDEISLDSLAGRSAIDIMAHLSSPTGTVILEKLEMTRPTSDEAGQLARWILAVKEKPEMQRKADIVATIAKHMQGLKGKRSLKLRLASSLLEKEEVWALCKLIAYPKLLEAKARLLQQIQT